MSKDQLVLKIYKYLDEGYLVSEIAEVLDISEDEVWNVIEKVEADEDANHGYECYK